MKNDPPTLISTIETLNDIQDIENYLHSLSQLVKTKNEIITLLSTRIKSNETQLKQYIIDSSENIINVFTKIQSLKKDFETFKRNFDSYTNQTIILKRKYIEPFEKLKQSITNKANIDEVIILYDSTKNFKNDIKLLHNHYLQDTLTLSANTFDLYIRIRTKYPLNKFINITYIKEEFEWFNRTDSNIISKYRTKFEESILTKNNSLMLTYFNFYSKLNLLSNEITSFSNKILNELMVSTFLNKIIKNTINPIELLHTNILKIRKELEMFFESVENYYSIFTNMSKLLKSSYDKNKFILYENILEMVCIILICFLL